MSKFVKDDKGGWYNPVNNYYIGTGREGDSNFYDHLISSGDMTLSDVIDHIMESVNSSLEEDL